MAANSRTLIEKVETRIKEIEHAVLILYLSDDNYRKLEQERRRLIEAAEVYYSRS